MKSHFLIPPPGPVIRLPAGHSAMPTTGTSPVQAIGEAASQPVETPSVKVATQPVETPGARPVVHSQSTGASSEEVQVTRPVE